MKPTKVLPGLIPQNLHQEDSVLVAGQVCSGKSKNRETISIMAGTLDQSYGLEAADHIYVNDKADYYELTDDLPKIPQDRLSQS